MEKLLKWIGGGILIGWTVAMLVNFPIYQHLTGQPTLIHPVADGILFMVIMIGFYVLIWKTFQRKKKNANIQLATIGTLAMVLAVVLLF